MKHLYVCLEVGNILCPDLYVEVEGISTICTFVHMWSCERLRNIERSLNVGSCKIFERSS